MIGPMLAPFAYAVARRLGRLSATIVKVKLAATRRVPHVTALRAPAVAFAKWRCVRIGLALVRRHHRPFMTVRSIGGLGYSPWSRSCSTRNIMTPTQPGASPPGRSHRRIVGPEMPTQSANSVGVMLRLSMNSRSSSASTNGARSVPHRLGARFFFGFAIVSPVVRCSAGPDAWMLGPYPMAQSAGSAGGTSGLRSPRCRPQE